MMSKNIIAIPAILVSIMVFAMTINSSALAVPAIVERAKAECIVGEQASGYLGFVPGKTATTELQREVRRINQERKAVYASIARKNGVSVEVTASLTAQKLIQKAARGECVRGTNGQWVKK